MKKLMFTMAVALACVAMAQEGELPPPGAMHGGPAPMAFRQGAPMDPLMHIVMNPKVAEKIGLSEEQKAKLKELQPKRGANKELNEKISAGMKREMELLNAEKIDEAAVMATIDEVFEIRKELAKEQTKRLIAIKSVLTPEQIKAAREAMKEMRGPRMRRPRGPEVDQ